MKTRPMGDIERALLGWMRRSGKHRAGILARDLALREWETGWCDKKPARRRAGNTP
jgi:hypothetical protein